MRHFVIHSIAAAGCFIAAFGSAATNAAPHKILDLRNQSDASGEYSISLCARPSPGPAGLPGHAFVTYSFKPANGERRIASIGFTTAAGTLKGVLSYSAFLATPAGYLGEEKYSSINENCLIALVNESEFNQAMSLAKPFANLPGLDSLTYLGVYSLTSNDCITFTSSVAKTLETRGLKVPARAVADTPPVYLRKLIEAN